MTLQLDAVPKRDASIQQRRELQREVDALKVSLEKKVEMLHANKKELYSKRRVRLKLPLCPMLDCCPFTRMFIFGIITIMRL